MCENYKTSIALPSGSFRWLLKIYNYLCNRCISPLMLWVGISIRARCTTLCNKKKVCQWLLTRRWFPHGPSVSSNKADRHNITEILLKVALNTIKQTNTIEYICWRPVWLFRRSCICLFIHGYLLTTGIFKLDITDMGSLPDIHMYY